VLDPGRARGGFEGLKSAALANGNARTLGLRALASVEARRRLLSIFRRERDDDSRLSKASGVLVRAAKGLRSLCERHVLTGEIDRRQLLAVARELTASVEALQGACESSALANASPSDLTQIGLAYAAHVEACVRYREAFAEVLSREFPQMLGTPTPDPIEEAAARAVMSMRTMVSFRELFARREFSHSTAARKSPPRWISDSSRSAPST
jgi:hypothetical protein